MKNIPNLLFILSLIIFSIGFLPILFSYPYNDSNNSGPSNTWELILTISYDLKPWCLITSKILLLISVFLYKYINKKKEGKE